MTRTYADAIASLNSVQTNFAVLNAIHKSGRTQSETVIPEMIGWLRTIGYQTSDLNKLNAIHVAGTKGKGSTAAFISSILTKFRGSDDEKSGGRTLSKIGLYTSPHLRFVRERIQINGEPLSEEKFTQYFFEVWDRLEDAAKAQGKDPKDRTAKPFYFHYLTLMAFHSYLSEGVDAAIMETGIGGELDSTNIIPRPVVTGITSLGLDHVKVLGETLPEIAWHKAGIIKNGSKCYTTIYQPAETKPVLERRSAEAKTELVYVDIDPQIASGEYELGLQADFQKMNASIALAIAKEWLAVQGFATGSDAAIQKIRKGLKDVRWGGRCETRQEPGITWCIDGGHTLDSINMAAKWYASVLRSQPKLQASAAAPLRYLIFNQQTRDADALAKALHETLAAALGAEKPFTHAIFCTNMTFKEAGFKPDLVSMNTSTSDLDALRVQNQLAQTWTAIDPTTKVEVVKTIEEAVYLVRDAAKTVGAEGTPVTALVTGSLHLVGGFLEVLESGS